MEKVRGNKQTQTKKRTKTPTSLPIPGLSWPNLIFFYSRQLLASDFPLYFLNGVFMS